MDRIKYNEWRKLEYGVSALAVMPNVMSMGEALCNIKMNRTHYEALDVMLETGLDPEECDRLLKYGAEEAQKPPGHYEMSSVRAEFLQRVNKQKIFTVCVVAVQLPSGAVETITNYAGIPEKIKYYKTAYNDKFELESNTNIKIIGFMLV
jgi:hypothetical protein